MKDSVKFVEYYYPRQNVLPKLKETLRRSKTINSYNTSCYVNKTLLYFVNE